MGKVQETVEAAQKTIDGKKNYRVYHIQHEGKTYYVGEKSREFADSAFLNEVLGIFASAGGRKKRAKNLKAVVAGVVAKYSGKKLSKDAQKLLEEIGAVVPQEMVETNETEEEEPEETASEESAPPSPPTPPSPPSVIQSPPVAA